MKTKFVISCFVSLLAVGEAFAQKGELFNAQDNFDNYEKFRGQKALADQAKKALDDAKTSIDKAAVNPKTATMPLTYAIHGGIYAVLALNDTVLATSTVSFATADEALKKAKETDTKNENTKYITLGFTRLAQYKLNRGVKDYGSHNFAAAYEDFDYYRSVRPTDTVAIYYTGLAAANAEKYKEAITNYTALLSTKYSKVPDIYSDLAVIYLRMKDTATALKIIDTAVSKYPNNVNLTTKQVNMYISANKKTEVIGKLQKAIANDPKNKLLYFNAGILYTQAKDPDKALDMYKKALEIDPDYFEANVNAGFLIMNPAIQLVNKANKLPTNKQKEYDADMAQAVTMFDQAKPYLIRATQDNPKSIDAWSNLRTYYLGKRDDANAAAVSKTIADLKAKGGN